ncbi:MFS transporter [uncultured Cohaesibacter sp.]|uniref:MFS transporter n=1 Tax=uncultured Cohaesibacter sp. TaxID=1002546 RepID=UPI00292E53B6|nr:MFS transporter [uncultured Cohaesibacter sp.]
MPHSNNKVTDHAAYFALMTVFLDAVGIGIISPIIPELLQNLTHTNISEAATYGGYLTFVYAAMQFIFAPILGNLSDSIGRRPVLLISLAALAIDYLILGFAGSLSILFAGRLIAGIFGATPATVSAFMTDISTGKQRTKNFGLLGASFGAGFVAGPLIGGLLAEYGVRVPFFAAFALVLLNFFYGLFILPESLAAGRRRSFTLRGLHPFDAILTSMKAPAVGLLLLAFFLFNMADHSYVSVWPFYTREAFQWGSRQVGFTLAIFGFFHALTQIFVIGFLLRRMSETAIAVFGILSTALIMITFLFISEGWIVYLFLPFSALGGLTMPAIQALLTQRTADTHQGQLQGAISSVMSLTTIFSPLIMTQVFYLFTKDHHRYYHPAGVFGFAALICFLALIPLIRANKGA